MSWKLAAFFAFLLAFSAAAQQPEQPLKPLVSSVEVSVTNVDVIVTDSKGKRVPDLTRDDFVLLEDGVPQTITNFYAAWEGQVVDQVAETPGALPGPAGPKARISILVDNLNLTSANRARALNEVGNFVAGALGPNVEATVATWDRKLLPRGPFTSDGAALKAILQRLDAEPTFGNETLVARDQLLRQVDQALATSPRDRTRDALLRSAIQASRGYALDLGARVDDTTHGVATAVDQLAGLEGRKVLIYVSERLPQIPGAEIFEYLREAVGLASPLMREIPTDFEFDRKERFKDIVKAAHAAGVAVYSLEARGATLDSHLSAERPAPAGRLNTAREESNTVAMLQVIAEETGGAAVFSRNSFQSSLEELVRDFSTYYSLGYQSKNPEIGKTRRVTVKVPRGYRVRARTGHVEKSPEARVGDTVLSRLWFPKVQNPLAARLDTGKPTKKGKSYVLPLRFFLPFDKLTLIPEGAGLKGRVVLRTAALDETGRLSPVRMQAAPIEVPASATGEIAGKDFIFDTEVELRAVKQTISIALTDEPSRATSYVQMPLNVTAGK